MKNRSFRRIIHNGLVLVVAAVCVGMFQESGWSQSPPMMSVNVSPGYSPVQGVTSATEDGLGATLLFRQGTRNVRRSGTHDVTNPDNEQIVSQQTTLVLDYRFLDKMTAILSIPRLANRYTYGNVGQSTIGLGDIAALMKYSIYKGESAGLTREFLGIAGVELPTGATGLKDNTGALLPATQQAGSDTTDFIVGGAGIWGLPLLTLYGDVTYKINGNKSYRFGNSLAANIGASVPVPRFEGVSLLTAFNGQFNERDKSAQSGPGVLPGGTVRDTGGETFYFAPALQFSSGSDWAVTTGIQLPIAQNYRGTQLKSDVYYTSNVHMRFFTGKNGMMHK